MISDRSLSRVQSYDYKDIVRHDYAKRKFQMNCTHPFDEQPNSSGDAGGEPNLSGDAGGESNLATNVADSEQTREDVEKFKRLLTYSLCFVFRSQLGAHSLLYSGSMECFESKPSSVQTDSSQISSVELRAAKTVTTGRHANNLKKLKTLRWYCHSLFTNNRKFAIAQWPEDFIVNGIKECSLDDLVEMSEGEWSREVCLYQVSDSDAKSLTIG